MALAITKATLVCKVPSKNYRVDPAVACSATFSAHLDVRTISAKSPRPFYYFIPRLLT